MKQTEQVIPDSQQVYKGIRLLPTIYVVDKQDIEGYFDKGILCFREEILLWLI